MPITYLDGPRLRRALVAGCEYVQLRRAELNRINVFPVPDGDTGTNLALTASAIAERLRPIRQRSVSLVAREAADAAILGARGNCGMIFSHFLLGFATALGEHERVRSAQFADALQAAVEHVYHSLERPVEGTIITVMRATAEHARQAHSTDFGDLLETLLLEARQALERTPDLLPALRKAGVVDAGAKGFVHVLEGARAFVHGQPFLALPAEAAYQPAESLAAALAEYPLVAEQFRSARRRWCAVRNYPKRQSCKTDCARWETR
ncbi:MAG: DAK2 domain-containing protein [Longimicrobiales bacterium]